MTRVVLAALLASCFAVPVLAHDSSGHAHGAVDVAADAAPRIVELTVEPDPVGGVNLFVTTANFEFAPRLVNLDHVPGKGHGHIYVDGVKVARLYGPAYHLDGLAAGERRIEVTLYANDHREYAVDGTKVSAATTFVAP